MFARSLIALLLLCGLALAGPTAIAQSKPVVLESAGETDIKLGPDIKPVELSPAAPANSAARAGRGENRQQSADDGAALSRLKAQLDQVLNKFYDHATGVIGGFDGDIASAWPQVEALYNTACTRRGGTPSGTRGTLACNGIPSLGGPEQDPNVRGHVRTNVVGAGATLPVCNPQTQDLRFNPSTNQWSCHDVTPACGGTTLWQ